MNQQYETAASSMLDLAMTRHTQAWNALIPKRAVRVEVDFSPTHVRYLHPTKGWRCVAKKRLGLPIG